MTSNEKKGRGRPRKKPLKSGRRKKEVTDKGVQNAEAFLEAMESPLALENEEKEYEHLFGSITPQQKAIVRMKLKGMGVREIATLMGTTYSNVAHQLSNVRKFFASKGKTVDQDITLGETMSVYDEVTLKAWELFNGSEDPGVKIKALNTVLSAKAQHTKLLMDVGKLDKAAKEVIVTTQDTPPFLAKIKANPSLIQQVLEATLSPLAQPEPPMLEAEIVEEGE